MIKVKTQGDGLDYMNSGYSKGLLRDSISWCVKTSVWKMVASPVFVDWPVVRNLNEHKSQCFVFQKSLKIIFSRCGKVIISVFIFA